MSTLKKNQIDIIIQEEFDQYQSLLDNANKYPLLASYILSESGHISRKNMPQVDTKNLSKAIDMIGDNIKVSAGTIQAGKLKRSQKELHKDKIVGISKSFKNAKDLKPLVISSDNYIIDGHHRWAASVHKWGASVAIPIIKIGLPKIKAITLFNRISDQLGQMKQESIDELWGYVDLKDSKKKSIVESLFKADNALKPHEKLLVKSVVEFMLNKFNIKPTVIVRKNSKDGLFGDVVLNDNSLNKNKFYVNFNKSQSYGLIIKSLIHELIHVKQISKGELKPSVDWKSLLWKGKPHITVKDYKKMMRGDINSYIKLPWEREAYSAMNSLYKPFINSKEFKDKFGNDDNFDYIYSSLTEVIEIPIEIGDTVLGGKFKNKKIVVKSIDKNEKGDITINGKPLLKFRIIESAISGKMKCEQCDHSWEIDINDSEKYTCHNCGWDSASDKYNMDSDYIRKNGLLGKPNSSVNEAQSKLKLNIPKNVADIHKAFKKEGKKLYIVGGAVRDAILGQKPKDFDLATDAKPDEVLDIAKRHGFKTAEVGKQFGVVIINGEEVATFRKDIGKGRRPDAVDYTDIYGDVKRRDLTINALFYDIDRQQIVDLVGGIADLKNKFVRTVGKAEERFDEDPLRKLRALRFTARIGGRMEKSTLEALKSDPSLTGVSSERIRDEFIKSIKSAKSQKSYLKMVDKLKMLQQILPNIKYSTDFIENSNYKLVIAHLLRQNTADSTYKQLKTLKYADKESLDISFLIKLSRLQPNDAYKLKKIQKNTTLSDAEIIEWGKIVNTDLKKFVKFKLSVSGNDVTSLGLKGKEIGDKIEKMEIDNYLNESSDDRLQMLKLMNKAMKAFPNSPNQKKIIVQLNVLRKRNGLEPLKEESINEMSKSDVQKIDSFADKQMNPIDINLTGGHFFDRLNDPRNNKEISSAELIGFFKRLGRKKKEFVDFLSKYNQIVAVDDKTNINIPFMKKANSAIAKTVMRKKDFKTADKKITI
jgi:tRNA nucleotidyltransferase (CCA-adding enzyme)